MPSPYGNTLMRNEPCKRARRPDQPARAGPADSRGDSACPSESGRGLRPRRDRRQRSARLTFQRRVVWAVAPYTPAAPFEIDDGQTWREYDAAAIAAGIRNRELAGTLTFAVSGKTRPVLAISEPSETTDEITALRLTNLNRRVRTGRVTTEELKAIRQQAHQGLFHLRAKATEKFAQSPGDEYAAITDALVRLHRSAITTAPVGEINPAGFQVLCQRLIIDLGLDVADLVSERAAELNRRANTWNSRRNA